MDNATVIEALTAIVGAPYVLTASEDMAPFLHEPRGLFHGTARAIVKPASTTEVAAVMRLANDLGLAVVPQGGNTGLVGGQTPDAQRPAIVLSLQRLDRIREVDAVTDTITVDGGVTLLKVQEAAEAADRLFPLSLASEGSCTIGGNIASNAGGTAVLAYGNTRDLVLGLEVVLADGRILNTLGKLRKDNTGYDLKNLFIGSEGSLGIVTGAVLKLFPRPRQRITVFCAIPSPDAAVQLLARVKSEIGSSLTTFEIMPRIGIELVVRHAPGARDPFAEPHPWYVLIELSSQIEGDLDAKLEHSLGGAIEDGLVLDAVLAASLDQRLAFWGLREHLSEVQGREGGSIKHDVSVPIAEIPILIEEASAAAEKLIPGIRPVPFGHIGDGNIHFNFSQPVDWDKQAFLDRWHDLNEVVHAIVIRHGGSISAEHGIGRLKRAALPAVKDPVAMELMRTLKAALDPSGILNPGVIV
ncbi:MAG: FAD-binding oxidoreductase [Chelatococcus sp.]|jgi:FAD/FMN-containing dehydrogenase|uniref:FAD-binding oxidoreductase n=1 Tax=unclassified Chelatococcus TaxID=2638111 RepID=UPI001BCBF13D|nr:MULTISPECIES: FAD-binding oxidoreductase [unclassified Chelatococcus]CAH1648642.1 4-phosphoerythronate dehydrogenase (FAD-dependent) [Hyphomicrobiales bacterium]MBS7739477.1 FAD-binding oxidoreductase [Chelatococcus sp. HY11]MBX3536464.1 FAD-binding oxidoreductase [Chelatococcus sp.]MBX3543846.1 FAD-binding oxidoreductase [Chelatococcus sp.]MCO5075987.1 FAD-binding oxidoreductase [Chelatococcus sp.]